MTFKAYDPSEFPPFAVTTDLVVLTVRDQKLLVLLVERTDEPFRGSPALPGGFVGPDSDLMDSARSTLIRKTGVDIDSAHLEQLGSYGHPNRDPRMRIVSVAYLAMLPKLPDPVANEAGSWVSAASTAGENLAFDHNTIVADGIERARAKLEYTTLATSFCPPEFTIGDLRAVYEAVWGEELDPSNFHRKVMATDDFVVATGETSSGGRGRPARIYRAGSALALSPPLHRP